MKRSFLILAVGLTLAIIAFACSYIFTASSGQAMTNNPSPELAWLKQEYQLSNEQYTRECELYAAYHPKCMEMCRKIDAQNMRLKKLLAATNVVTPEIEQALNEQARLRAECEANMLNHFYAVSQVMPPEQGKRYLAWMQEETLISAPMSINQRQPNNNIRKKI